MQSSSQFDSYLLFQFYFLCPSSKEGNIEFSLHSGKIATQFPKHLSCFPTSVPLLLPCPRSGMLFSSIPDYENVTVFSFQMLLPSWKFYWLSHEVISFFSLVKIWASCLFIINQLIIILWLTFIPLKVYIYLFIYHGYIYIYILKTGTGPVNLYSG